MDPSKRLNYLVGEDFYFLTYNVVLLIHLLRAGPSASVYRDHRKVAHLVEFCADYRLLSILDRHVSKPVENPVDRELLLAAYARGEMRKHEVRKILITLANTNLLAISRSPSDDSLDVATLPNSKLWAVVRAPQFADDAARIAKLRKLVPRMAAMTYGTFIQRIYVDRGLRVWAV